MPKKTWIVFILILLPAFLFSQTDFKVNSSRVLEINDFFAGLYPRLEGAAGERDALSFCKGVFRTLKVPFRESSFQDMEGDHSFSYNLEVDIPGKLKDQLIIAVPLTQEENALKGRDGSINLALALVLIEEFLGTEPPVSLKFCFFGGGYKENYSYPLGISRFLNDFFPENPTALVYINFHEIPETIVIRSGGRYVTAPFWLLDRISTALSQTDIPIRLIGNEHQVFRIGLTDVVTPIEPFLSSEYPAIELNGEGRTAGKREAEEWISSFLQFSHFLMRENRSGFPDEWDKHYLIFQFGGRKTIIKETTYLIILLSMFTLFFFYGVLFKNRIFRYLKILVRHLDALPVVFLFIFLCLLVSGLLLEGINLIKEDPGFWKSLPLLFFLLKITAALFLFFLGFRFLRRRYFSIRGSFYSAAALLFLLLTTVTTAVINISFSYYFAWAFIWTFIFTLFRRRSLKLICLILSPLWLFKALYDVFTMSSFKVIDIVLFSRFSGNLLVALFILPFVLKLIRLSLLHKHSVGRRLKRQNIIVLVFFGFISVSLGTYLFFYDPWNRMNQHVLAEEVIDINASSRFLTVRSEAPLQPFTVTGEGYSRNIEAGEREMVLQGGAAPELLRVEQEISSFLDRAHVVLTIFPEGEPERIRCTIKGEPKIVIFDAGFPFSVDPEGKEGVIYIGRNPPVPLTVEFTLGKETTAVLLLEIFYRNIPYELELKGERMEFETVLRVKKEVSLLEYNPSID